MAWLRFGIAKGVGVSGHPGGIQSSPGYARGARARYGIKRSGGVVVRNLSRGGNHEQPSTKSEVSEVREPVILGK